MSLRKETPCDFGPCPYEAEGYCTCEYWCGADEPDDYPTAAECGYDEEEELNFAPPIDIFPDEDETWEELNNGFSFPQDNPPEPIGTPAVWVEWEKNKESQ